MDALQERHERAVGDRFFDWYNGRHSTSFAYHGRAGEAPDLVYRDAGRAVRLEVRGCYYNNADALVMWQNARKLPNAPKRWSGVGFDEDLIANINTGLKEKCAKAYGSACWLIISLRPAMTTAEEVSDMMGGITIPERNPFDAIYLTGVFPVSTSSAGGYRCWRLA
jgi:hypothetical protein